MALRFFRAITKSETCVYVYDRSYKVTVRVLRVKCKEENTEGEAACDRARACVCVCRALEKVLCCVVWGVRGGPGGLRSSGRGVTQRSAPLISAQGFFRAHFKHHNSSTHKSYSTKRHHYTCLESVCLNILTQVPQSKISVRHIQFQLISVALFTMFLSKQ